LGLFILSIFMLFIPLPISVFSIAHFIRMLHGYARTARSVRKAPIPIAIAIFALPPTESILSMAGGLRTCLGCYNSFRDAA
jgi:hypothetical protein